MVYRKNLEKKYALISLTKSFLGQNHVSNHSHTNSDDSKSFAETVRLDI